jgi:hypothetical protein
MAAGPGSPSTGAARPDDPIIVTSRWGRPAHQPPHCSPMGISWGSIPQGSPLSNHPSRRRRAQVRLAAPAERRGGFGTCAQSGRQGDQRTWLYLSLPAHRLSARPDPTRRTYISERGARAQSSEPTSPGRNSPRGTPAWTRPRSDPRVRTRDYYILRLGPANPGLPGSQSNAAAARRHGSRSREANSQECVDTHGASSQDDPARTPPSWNCLNRSTRLFDTGWRLPPFVGCFRSTPTVLDPMHGTTTRKGAGPKRRVASAPCCSPDGPALEVPSWLRH